MLSIPVVSLKTNTETASGSFTNYGVHTIGSANVSQVQISTCDIFQRTSTMQQILQGVAPVPLNAGAQLTLNGPNASNVALPMLSGSYLATLYSTTSGVITGNPTPVPGSYTISGTGGPDIGAFQASINLPADLTWTPSSRIRFREVLP